MENIMSGSSGKQENIWLGEDFDEVVVHGPGVHVEVHADGSVDAYTLGVVKVHAATNDTTAKATTHEIGTIENTGEHKGEIYGGLYPADKKPIWFSAAPSLMHHYDAAAWAEAQGGSLPTRKHGDYLTTLKGKGGAFAEIFNRGGSFSAGCVWLAEPNNFYSYYAWCQRLSDGAQDLNHRNLEMPVLSVRR
jgi:hypothetical protein